MPATHKPSGLTAGEYAWLRQLGLHVELTPTEHRHFAITTVVNAASRCRDHADWPEIALAIGISATLLRSWRDQVHSAGKNGVLPPIAPKADPTIQVNPTVLIVMTGHPGPERNDYATEAAGIRQQCGGFFTVVAIPCVAIDEISRTLDKHQPNLLHIAAHCEHGAVHLNQDGAAVPILLGHFAQAITRARHRPSLTVLNFCDSQIAGRLLATQLPNLITWPGEVDDRQCREFNDVFYRSLIRGGTLGNSYDDATITVQRWTGLVPPTLIGDRTFRIPTCR